MYIIMKSKILPSHRVFWKMKLYRWGNIFSFSLWSLEAGTEEYLPSWVTFWRTPEENQSLNPPVWNSAHSMSIFNKRIFFNINDWKVVQYFQILNYSVCMIIFCNECLQPLQILPHAEARLEILDALSPSRICFDSVIIGEHCNKKTIINTACSF